MNLRFEQRLNAEIPLALSFTNERGEPVALRDCFGSRPVILVLGYYECPMLCSLVVNGLVESLQDIRPSAGKDFDVIFVSIDPHETPALAAAKKRHFLKRYGRAGTDQGWHFLTGQERDIRALARAIGFQFAYDSAARQYAHPSGIVVLTPDGRVARYFFGVSFPAAELSAALRQASARRSGSPVREILILCFQNMPLVGKHSGGVVAAVRGLGVATMFAVGVYVVRAVRRERRRRAPVEPSSSEPA